MPYLRKGGVKAGVLLTIARMKGKKAGGRGTETWESSILFRKDLLSFFFSHLCCDRWTKGALGKVLIALFYASGSEVQETL